ncbi:MAG: hypothetical protein FJZ56_03435 [Chlamydiae bacterium]|nr:hypothetical protein [Chlamydiota bacterium]
MTYSIGMDIFDIQQERNWVELAQMTGIQDAMQMRFAMRSRSIAKVAIEQGVKFVLEHLKKIDYPFCPQEDLYFEHVKEVLKLIDTSEEAKLFLRRLNLPLATPFVEKMVRISLLMKKEEKIEDKHAKIALIAALLTPLRQSVGSCFATAPAIVLQKQSPLRVLEDLYDLLTTGRLKRVVEGKELKVPMSLKTGYGDLKKVVLQKDILKFLPSVKHALGDIEENQSWFPCTIEEFFSHFSDREDAKIEFKTFTENPLLKMWEYTVASFSDFKVEFYKWNLFATLGFDHNEQGGIGERLFSSISTCLENEQKNSEKLREDVMLMQEQVRGAEILLRNAYTEDKIRRLKAELEIRNHQLLLSIHAYEDSVQNIEYCAKFFQFLVDQFLHLFPQYFLELYDPEMFEMQGEIYEDMPAGFRLVYKHGRYDPSVWSLIYTKEEYISSLCDFIHMVEPQLIAATEWKKGKEFITEICKDIREFFHEEDFLKKASERIAKLHKAHIQGVRSTIYQQMPWAYSSGGSLLHLLKSYFGFKNEIITEKFSPSSCRDLAVYLTDFVKDLPANEAEKRLLISSSTHAFSLEPKLFKQAWSDLGNTHTWLRDFIFKPQESFYKSILLSPQEQEFLSQKIGLHIKEPYELTLQEFSKIANRNLDPLYRLAFPLMDKKTIPNFLSYIEDRFLLKKSKEAIDVWLEKQELKEILLFEEMHILLENLLLFLEIENGYDIVEEFIDKPPSAFMFADTNWPTYYFGILFSPTNERFELWRLDLTGYKGYPMTSWQELGTWVIYRVVL